MNCLRCNRPRSTYRFEIRLRSAPGQSVTKSLSICDLCGSIRGAPHLFDGGVQRSALLKWPVPPQGAHALELAMTIYAEYEEMLGRRRRLGPVAFARELHMRWR